MFQGRSLRMFPECSREKFYERSIQMLSERSYGRFQERSLWIFSENCCGTFSQYSFWTFLERSAGTFREHCFETLKKPEHLLSSRNVPMEPSEHSMGTFIEHSGKVLCYGGGGWSMTQICFFIKNSLTFMALWGGAFNWYGTKRAQTFLLPKSSVNIV